MIALRAYSHKTTHLFWPIVLLALSSATAQRDKTDHRPIVSITTGRLRGLADGNAAVFKGIPFARAPIGELRWREPQDSAAWTGVRDASAPSKACPQTTAGIGDFIGPLADRYGATYKREPVESSEDCLYLNVWAPVWPPKAARPVMVWLHGGSNMIGSGAQSAYDGTSLARLGVLVVTINYRLGVLGFFAHPQLTAESPHHSSGNYGLLDQLAAFRWVQTNIAQFGGDPKNVTLFGESAGAVDAGVLMTSPLAVNLFKRVISESGPAFGLGPPRTLKEGEDLGAVVGRKVAAPDSPADQIAALRRLSPQALAALAGDVSKETKSNVIGSVIDGWVFRESPAKAFAAGREQKVGLLIGNNARELSAFRVVAAERKQDTGGGMAGGGLKQLSATIRPLYGNWTDLALALYMSKAIVNKVAALDQASNDLLVACPAGAMASLTQDAGQPSFVYEFMRSIPGKGEADLGAFHSIELPYVFDAFSDRTWSWLPFTNDDHALSSTIQAYWTNFAKSGNPNGPGLPVWLSWDPNTQGYIEFGKDGKVAVRKGFAPPFCHLAPDYLRQHLGAS